MEAKSSITATNETKGKVTKSLSPSCKLSASGGGEVITVGGWKGQSEDVAGSVMNAVANVVKKDLRGSQRRQREALS